jgi:transcriptional regulator with XRE-family HTH domain
MPLSHLERKAKLVLSGRSQSDLAAELDVAPQHVSEVIRGDRRSRRVEQAIADAIGMPVEQVFPPPSDSASEAA